jgi:nucleoside-diphosphate-sugar epimerase
MRDKGMKIAILGATGHLAKCAFWAYSQDKSNTFYLYSRSLDKLKDTYDSYGDIAKNYIADYGVFAEHDYDIIFNGIGVWDTPNRDIRDIFYVTEHYDNMIIEYLKQHPDTTSIYVSSGAAYASDFLAPVDKHSTTTAVNINDLTDGNYYSIAKMNSEAKHRAMSELNIADIRLFGFFSRFVSLDYPYLLSGLVKAVRDQTVFKSVAFEFWRDFIHLDDFTALLTGIAATDRINVAIDARSKAPVSKNELVDLFVNRYGLRFKTDYHAAVSVTGAKPYYFSRIDNPIYIPRYTSLETIECEVKFFLEENS